MSADWSTRTLLLIRTTAGTTLPKLEWSDLRLLRIVFVLFTPRANEVEIGIIGLLRLDAMTLAVLPDIALLTSNAVSAVVEVVAVLVALHAIEVPVVVLLRDPLQFLLVAFSLRLVLPTGGTFDPFEFDNPIGRILGRCTSCIFFQLRQLLLV